MVRHIARIDLDDGLILEAEEATADTIRDDDQYAGIRVSLPGRLDRAVFRFHVDLNFGDPIADVYLLTTRRHIDPAAARAAIGVVAATAASRRRASPT